MSAAPPRPPRHSDGPPTTERPQRNFPRTRMAAPKGSFVEIPKCKFTGLPWNKCPTCKP